MSEKPLTDAELALSTAMREAMAAVRDLCLASYRLGLDDGYDLHILDQTGQYREPDTESREEWEVARRAQIEALFGKEQGDGIHCRPTDD